MHATSIDIDFFILFIDVIRYKTFTQSVISNIGNFYMAYMYYQILLNSTYFKSN